MHESREELLPGCRRADINQAPADGRVGICETSVWLVFLEIPCHLFVYRLGSAAAEQPTENLPLVVAIERKQEDCSPVFNMDYALEHLLKYVFPGDGNPQRQCLGIELVEGSRRTSVWIIQIVHNILG